MQILTYVVAWINMWTLIQAVVTPANQDGCTAEDDMSEASTGKSLLQAPATKSAVMHVQTDLGVQPPYPLEDLTARAPAEGVIQSPLVTIVNATDLGVQPPYPPEDVTARAPAEGVIQSPLVTIVNAPPTDVTAPEEVLGETSRASPVAPMIESPPENVTALAPAQEFLVETSPAFPVAPMVESPPEDVTALAPAQEFLVETSPASPVAPMVESPPEDVTALAPAKEVLVETLPIAPAEGSERVNTMLVDLFGQPDDMQAAADYWVVSGLHDTMEHLAAAPKEEDQHAAALWVRLTRALVKGGKFPLPRINEHTATSAARQSLNLWNAKVAAGLGAEGVSGIKCAETGDGHFLKADFTAVCAEILSVDKYDPKSDVKIDLSLPPVMAPTEMVPWFGTFDVLVSHQVFEHLQHPVAGMANLNAMVRPGGTLFFTTPFLVQDHHDPFDYFRYTLRNVHGLLECSGFQVAMLEGLGGYIGSISYMAGVAAEDLDAEDLTEVCDGLTTDFCKDHYYTLTAAKGIKTREASYEEIRDCFG